MSFARGPMKVAPPFEHSTNNDIKFHLEDKGQWRPIRSHASFRGLMASRWRLLGLFLRSHSAPEQSLEARAAH